MNWINRPDFSHFPMRQFGESGKKWETGFFMGNKKYNNINIIYILFPFSHFPTPFLFSIKNIFSLSLKTKWISGKMGNLGNPNN